VSGFGKRNTGKAAGQDAPRGQRSARPAPGPADLLSAGYVTARDLQCIESGRMPVWMTTSKTRFLGCSLLLPLVMLAAILFYGPEVVRDLRHAGKFEIATDLRATDGNCKRYVFLVTLCSAKIHSLTAPGSGEETRQSEFMMFFRSGDGALLVPVRSTADASVVGIEYAVSDVLINRTLSLIGSVAFFAWVCWLFADCLRKGRYQGGAAHEAVLQYMALNARPA
jgi:hypothetical protein